MARNSTGGGRFNRPASKDYSKKDLPKTRMQLFGAMLRSHIGSLFLLNILYVVFNLPLWAWMFYNSVAFVTGGSEQFIADGAPIIMLAVAIPLIAFTGPAKAAMKYVLRNWARDEHASVFTDFVDAFKDNWKQALLFSSVNGVVTFLAGVAILFYGSIAAAGNLWGNFLLYFVIVLYLLWCMMNIYIWPMMVTYKMLVRDILRNSFVLLLGQLPRTALFGLITVFPMAFAMIGSLIGLIIVILYYVIYGMAITGFINVSFTNHLFDLYFTPQIVGEVSHRGLYKEEPDGE